MMSSKRSEKQPARLRSLERGAFLPRARAWNFGALGLAILIFGQPGSAFAQQTIRGEPSQATMRAVVNFRGLAELEKTLKFGDRYQLTSNSVPRGIMRPHAPTNGVPVGGGGGGGAPIPAAAQVPNPGGPF